APSGRRHAPCLLPHRAVSDAVRAESYATRPARATDLRRWHDRLAGRVFLPITPLRRPGRSKHRPPREIPMQRHALASALLCILALSACSTVGDEQVSSQAAAVAPSPLAEAG